jgi:hypothetical protein
MKKKYFADFSTLEKHFKSKRYVHLMIFSMFGIIKCLLNQPKFHLFS